MDPHWYHFLSPLVQMAPMARIPNRLPNNLKQMCHALIPDRYCMPLLVYNLFIIHLLLIDYFIQSLIIAMYIIMSSKLLFLRRDSWNCRNLNITIQVAHTDLFGLVPVLFRLLNTSKYLQ